MRSILILAALALAFIAATSTEQAEAGFAGKIMKGGALGMIGRICIKAPACRARGAGLVMQAGRAIIVRYGDEAVLKCAMSPACAASLIQSVIGGMSVVTAIESLPERIRRIEEARTGEVAGDIAPPGFCHPDDFDALNSLVNRMCKNGATPKCRSTDTPATLRLKISSVETCMKARIKREEMCFRGGDFGHRTQIGSLKNQLAKCWENYAEATK